MIVFYVLVGTIVPIAIALNVAMLNLACPGERMTMRPRLPIARLLSRT